MGRVNFSPLGLGFGFFDFAQVGFPVFGFFLGLRNFGFWFTSGPSFFFKSYIFELKRRVSTSKIWGEMAQVRQKLPWVEKKITTGWLGSSKKLLGSGRVGQNSLGSGFDPTHP